VVLKVLSSFSKQFCLVFTNVTSALEVFLNVMRYINPRFTYLLTYILYSLGTIIIGLTLVAMQYLV